MTLKNDRELAHTLKTLRHLEARYEALQADSAMKAHVRELTMHSLKRLINQMKEEVVLFQIHHPAESRGQAEAI